MGFGDRARDVVQRLSVNREPVVAVILTWNSAQHIRRCVESILASSWLRVIVVDNGSTDGTLEMLFSMQQSAGPSRLTIIPLGRNVGTTVSRNIAMRSSRDAHLLVMDSDAYAMEGALDSLIKDLETHPQAGIIAPQLLYPDGGVQRSCRRFPVLQEKVLKAIPSATTRKAGEEYGLYEDDVYALDRREVKSVEYCISAAWLIRKELVEAIGLFDERIFYSPEDVDFCVRARLAGWDVLYAPAAQFVHHTQRLSYKNAGIALRHFGGLLYYFRKHHYCFSARRLRRRVAGSPDEGNAQP